MTRVACFYAGNLTPETRQSVAQFAPAAEFVNCSEDDYAYWRAFKERWGSGDDFVVIEQDMEIGPDTIASFESCEHHWCVFPYRVISQAGEPGMCVESLGCTRFSAELQSVVKARHISQDDYRHWRQVAGRVAVTLTRYGYRAHQHDHLMPHHHSQDDYEARMQRGIEMRDRAFRTPEFLEAMRDRPDEKPGYWETRYDLPARR